jgi:hypothetical protein
MALAAFFAQNSAAKRSNEPGGVQVPLLVVVANAVSRVLGLYQSNN